jgi:hypothetical protein
MGLIGQVGKNLYIVGHIDWITMIVRIAECMAQFAGMIQQPRLVVHLRYRFHNR